MKKTILLIFFFTVYILFVENEQVFAGLPDEKQNVYSFVFRPGSELYEEGYESNASEWQNLIRQFTILPSTSPESCYFLIESFVGADEASDNYMINRAAFRGSLIRSLLKQRLDIPYEQVAFYINRSGRLSDVVRVTLVKSPMPDYVNRDIFFSFSSANAEISRSLSRYGQIPFYDFAMPEKPDVQDTGKTDAPVHIITDSHPVITDSHPVQSPSGPLVAEGELGARPFNLGIKTNLLPWLGLVPGWAIDGESASGYTTGPLMYNGALEYSFARRYSVELSFLYAYSSYDGRKDNLWGVSSITFEPRIWFSDNNRFRGFNSGFRMEYGDFDIRDNKPQNYGKTGRFYSAGFSLGYTLPVYSSWLLVEGRLSVCYRNTYDGKVYRFSRTENKNYYEDAFSQGNWLVGASVNILFRSGFRK